MDSYWWRYSSLQESSANEIHAYAVAIHPILLFSHTTINLITTFQIPGSGMNSLNANTAAISGDVLPWEAGVTVALSVVNEALLRGVARGFAGVIRSSVE